MQVFFLKSCLTHQIWLWLDLLYVVSADVKHRASIVVILPSVNHWSIAAFITSQKFVRSVDCDIGYTSLILFVKKHAREGGICDLTREQIFVELVVFLHGASTIGYYSSPSYFAGN